MRDYKQYLDDADNLINRNNKDGAIKVLKEAIAKYPDSAGGYYNLALLYHSLNNLDKAIELFEKAGKLNPIDSSIFNNLGVIYYAKSDFENSEHNFKKTINIENNNIDAIYGLGKIYQKLAQNGSTQKIDDYKKKLLSVTESLYKENKLDDAFKLSEKGLKLFPDETELLNSYAVICHTLEKTDEAKKSISKAIELSPEDPDIKDNYKLIFDEKKYEPTIQMVLPKQKTNKLAVFCGPDDKFITEIIEHLKSKFEIKRFRNGSIQDMQNLMKWSDISWFEWCDSLIIHATKLPKTCKTICRLHSYEALSDNIKMMNWNLVDDLIFVAPHIKDIALSQVPNIKDNTNIHVIPNGVNTQKYSFKERQKGFNIAYVGYINYKKNPSLLLQCIKHLIDIDDRYMLHIAGQYQELRYKLYFDHIINEMGLSKNVIFHGWIDDVNTWLNDKHFTVSTSVLESFCYGIADAMACGLKPVIHNFIGAKELYPNKYIFNSVKDFGEMILDDDYNPSEYREFIESHYSQEKQFNNIDELLNSIL